jgi:CDP-diacylglycerol pyrophosphatase
MKRKTLLMFMLIVAVAMMAETALIIKPLAGDEQANALEKIGYVKVTHDSLLVFSHNDFLLSKIAIKDVRHIRYGEPNEQQGIDDVNIATCRVYPNPAMDRLIIENANCEKVYIFDLNGRLLQTAPIDGERTSINVTSLPQGDYLLLLNNQTIKFIKQ